MSTLIVLAAAGMWMTLLAIIGLAVITETMNRIFVQIMLRINLLSCDHETPEELRKMKLYSFFTIWKRWFGNKT